MVASRGKRKKKSNYYIREREEMESRRRMDWAQAGAALERAP